MGTYVRSPRVSWQVVSWNVTAARSLDGGAVTNENVSDVRTGDPALVRASKR
jgi:hypothetical protein